MKAVVPRSRPISEGLGVAATDVVMNLFIFFLIAFSLLATFTKKKQIESEEHRKEAVKKEEQKLKALRDEQDRLKAAAREHAEDVELPLTARTAGEGAAGALIVEVTRDGILRLDGVAVERPALTGALTEAMRGAPRAVVLRADRRSQLGDAVTVLDSIRAAGPSSVSIATVER